MATAEQVEAAAEAGYAVACVVGHQSKEWKDAHSSVRKLWLNIARATLETAERAAWRPIVYAPGSILRGLVEYPSFYNVKSATCIVYEHDEGEAIGLVRATLDLDAGQWTRTHFCQIPPPPATGGDNG